ncbi:5-formyltetrahydrofolate cyclo-ligase [Paralimibaculum aggregatum]|uniref:5-formyltetrahydrofolate cyclo-ligase n=1 Tax=Paralimibaculum aggregatum TaxID=3036245 RepID=A0ABQ6LTX1_9RHOB|nr:5-formyltetrahydrofolate cyclo-ligase [Limibaculum sp. NKW23]GMG85548.1 5-formyltetrahydrofolate cyclo-ligase [Limibaculum sp. NKW23]
MSEELTAAKAAARRTAYAARKAAHADPGRRAAAARDAATRFLGAGLVSPGEIVAGYRPIRTEIDPTGLMQALAGRGHRLCVPVIEGEGLPLAFREWHPGCAMETGAFGAEIPAAGDWLEPTLLIAPLVAFDRGCWRLGYGGGFYDRTLALLGSRRPTRAVGFAYAAQALDAVPREATDQRLHAVVTEREVIRP